MPGKRHSCGNSGILEDRKYWKICKWVCFHKMSKPVLCKWNAWKVQIWSQRLAQVCEINLCGSNLALQRASDLILERAIPASVSCLFIYLFIFISFCIAFAHSSLLSNFLGPLRLKGVFAWLPELSAVIQTGQKLLKRAVRYFFPCLQHCIHFVTVIVGFSMFSRKCNVKNGPSKERDGSFMLT